MGLLEDAVSYAKETRPAQAEPGLLEQAVAFAKGVPQAEEPEPKPLFNMPEIKGGPSGPMTGTLGINEFPAVMTLEGMKWIAGEVPALMATGAERAMKAGYGLERKLAEFVGADKTVAAIDKEASQRLPQITPERTLERAQMLRELPHKLPSGYSALTNAALDVTGQALDKAIFWRDPLIKYFNDKGMQDVGPAVQFLTELVAFKAFHKGTQIGNKAYKTLNKARKGVEKGKSTDSILRDLEKDLEGLGLTKEDLSTPEARQAWINKQPGFEDYGQSVQTHQTSDWLRRDRTHPEPVNPVEPVVQPEPVPEFPGEPAVVSGAKTPAETNLEVREQQQRVQQLQQQVEPQNIADRDLPPEARRILEAAQRAPKAEPPRQIPPEVSGLDRPVMMTSDGRLFEMDGRELVAPGDAKPVEAARPVEPVAEPVVEPAPVADNSHKNLMEVGELKAEKSKGTPIDLDRLDDWVEITLEDLYKEGGTTRLHTIAKQLLETGELDSPGLVKSFKKWYDKQAEERRVIEAKEEPPPDINRVDPETGRPPGQGIEAPPKKADLGTSDLIAEVKQENSPLMRDDGTPIKSRAMAVKRAEALGRIGEVVKNPKGEGWIVKPTKAQRRKMKRQELDAWDKILESEGLTVEETGTASKGVRDLFDLIDNERGSVDADLLSAPIRKLMEAFGKSPKAGAVLNGLRKSNITKDDLRLSRFEDAISMNYKPQDRIDWKGLIDKAEKGYLDVEKKVLGISEREHLLEERFRELRDRFRENPDIAKEIEAIEKEIEAIELELEKIMIEQVDRPKYVDLLQYNVKGDEIGPYREHLFTNSKLANYKEAHWAEHGDAVFAHSRRTPLRLDDGTKALTAHDVQSVLHQKGLAEGYHTPELREEVITKYWEAKEARDSFDEKAYARKKDMQKEIRTLVSPEDIQHTLTSMSRRKHLYNNNRVGFGDALSILEGAEPIISTPRLQDAFAVLQSEAMSNTLRDIVKERGEELRNIRAEQSRLSAEVTNIEQRNKRVPDAPYKSDWYKLVMRDQVNEAVRTGMDGIAWTTAEFQNKASTGHTSEQVRILYDEKIPSFIKKEYGVEPVKKTSKGTEVWYAPVTEQAAKPLRGNTMLQVLADVLSNERGELNLRDSDFKKIRDLLASGKYHVNDVADSLVKKGATPAQIEKLTEGFIEKAQATGESKWLRAGQDPNEPLPRREKANGKLAPEIKRGSAHNLTQAKEMDARTLGESWSLETSNRGMERAGEAIRKEFYVPLRKATAEFQKEKKRVFREIDRLAKQFTQREKERIYSYATQLQEGGKEILQLQGKEVVTQLTPKELAAYEKMRTDFKGMYDRLNAARKAAGEPGFPAVDNYFTLANDIGWLRDSYGIGLYDNYKSVNGYLFGEHKTTPTSYHTKSRAADRQMLGINLYLDKAGHSHKLNGEQVKRVREYAQQVVDGEVTTKLTPEEMAVYDKAKSVVVKTINDPFTAYKRYMNESLDYIHRGPELARQKELLSDRYGLKEIAPNTHLFLSQWRDSQTGMKLPWDITNLKWRRRIQRMNKNVVMGYLAGAPQSALRQVGALPHTYAIAGQHTFGGILDAMSPAKWKMAWEKSDVLHTRSPEVSLDIARGYESQNKIVKVLDKASEAGLKPLDVMDKVTATASWLSFYRQAHAMKQFTTDAQRVRYADDWTAKTQGSASMLDRAPIQRSLIGGIVTGLQTFAINEFNFIAKDVLGIKNPEINAKTKLARTARFVAAVALFNWLQEEVLGMNAGAPTPVKTAREKADELGKNGELEPKEMIQVGAAGLSELANYIPLIGSALKYDTQLGGPTVSLMYEMASDLNKKGTVDPKDVATLLGRGDVRQALKMHEAYERNGSVMDIMLGNYVPKPREKKGGPVLP